MVKCLKKDNKVIIQISDNGPGLDEDLRTNIFTPFFTTKEVGKGMGLGLSLSYSLAKKMEGQLSLREFKETTFELSLRSI